MKVLIVDHDWRFTQQATSYLEGHAHLVVHEPAPTAALAKAAHWRPDLVILDVAHADKMLADLYKQSERPAILLTGWMDRYDKLWRAWQSGGDELLIKPILSDEDIHVAIVTALENAASGIRDKSRLAASA